jgi:hypothetical protein
MKRGRTQRIKRESGTSPLGRLTFYAVINLALLAGLMAYSRGASLDRALARGVAVLLISTLIGYGLNVILEISTRSAQVKAMPEEGVREELSAIKQE